jgi:hypothetical protein
MTSTAGAFKQQYLEYATGATNDYDNSFDVVTLNGNPAINFYSMLPNYKLVMQSRTLAFTDADVVPIGFTTTIAGDFTIAIDHTANWYSGQHIYLQDNLLGINYDLTTANYTFNTAVGTFDNRFVLKYTSSTLGNNSEDYLDSTIVIAKDRNVLKIKSTIEDMKSVVIYDLLGRKVYAKDAINAKEFSDVNIVRNQQTLIVKISLANGVVVSKKVVY